MESRAEMRYRTVHDDNGELYYIPADRTTEWYEHVSGPRPYCDTIPSYAVILDGNLTFADPKVDPYHAD